MDEKTMMNDVLEDIKGKLTTYQQAIAEAENIQLRNTIQQTRNTSESLQYELFKIAQTKGYYKPAEKADTKQISQVKTELEQ